MLSRVLAAAFLPPDPAFKVKVAGTTAKYRGVAYPLANGHARAVRELEGLLLSIDLRKDRTPFDSAALATLDLVEDLMNGDRPGWMFNVRLVRIESPGAYLEDPFILIVPEVGESVAPTQGVLVRYFKRYPDSAFLPDSPDLGPHHAFVRRVAILQTDPIFTSKRIKFEPTTTARRLEPPVLPKLGKRAIVLE